MFAELINWKLEQLNNMVEKEEKELETDLDKEQKQTAFDLMFKLDQTSTDDFDRIKSAASIKSSGNAVSPAVNGRSQKYALEQRRKKVAATKFILQDLLGKWIIPITTTFLLFLYMIVVLVQC